MFFIEEDLYIGFIIVCYIFYKELDICWLVFYYRYCMKYGFLLYLCSFREVMIKLFVNIINILIN